jgi:hypothetical protein
MGVARIHTVHHLVTLFFRTRLFITASWRESVGNGKCDDVTGIHQSNCLEVGEEGIRNDEINLLYWKGRDRLRNLILQGRVVLKRMLRIRA